MTDTVDRTHTIETDLGTFDVRLTGIRGDGQFTGELTAHETITIHGVDYEAAGSFSFSNSRHKWVKTSEKYADGRTHRMENAEIIAPFVWMTNGYRGLRRVEGNGDPTDKARERFGEVVGAAIAPILALPHARDEALDAQREEAARVMDGHARSHRAEAAREMNKANKYAAEAKRIRSGGEYDVNARFY